jgi:hypothetical protein
MIGAKRAGKTRPLVVDDSVFGRRGTSPTGSLGFWIASDSELSFAAKTAHGGTLGPEVYHVLSPMPG